MLATTCSESTGHTESWEGCTLTPQTVTDKPACLHKVEKCRVQTVSTDGGDRQSGNFFLHNGRGQSIEVGMIGHWGHNSAWIFVQVINGQSGVSLNDIFSVGDTLYPRKAARSTPFSVLAHSNLPCDVALLKPPASPPNIPSPPFPPAPPAPPPLPPFSPCPSSPPPPSPPPPLPPPPPIGDVMCPASGYTLEYDNLDGDKCRGPGGTNDWTPTVGCQDSEFSIPELAGPPRVIETACAKSQSHSAPTSWNGYVDQVRHA